MNVKQNLGSADSIVRLLAAAIIVILYGTNVISGTAAIILGSIGLILTVTALFRFCPLYLPFGFSTKRKR